MTAYPAFLALAPDTKTSAFIIAAKEQVRHIAGNQRYLDDPPHLTLFVGCYPDLNAVGAAIATAASRWRMPTVHLDGWHVFYNDPLATGNTLTCAITPETTSSLRNIQDMALNIASPLRDTQASVTRYETAMDRLSAIQRASLTRFGFPFTGADWQPHITIASIAPKYWDAVWPELSSRPPSGVLRLSALHWYGFEKERPMLIQKIAFAHA